MFTVYDFVKYLWLTHTAGFLAHTEYNVVISQISSFILTNQIILLIIN